MRKNFILLLTILLAGCNLPGSILGLGPATDTPTVAYEQCAWNWATQPLPELTAQVQSAMQAAGLKSITVRAEAFGENCILASGGVGRFATMETDYHITLQVESLTDGDHLGDLLEQILTVLDGFPVGTTPGPQPGYIGVSFHSGDQELNLWFTWQDGESARALGLHGNALLEKLQNK